MSEVGEVVVTGTRNDATNYGPEGPLLLAWPGGQLAGTGGRAYYDPIHSPAPSPKETATNTIVQHIKDQGAITAADLQLMRDLGISSQMC